MSGATQNADGTAKKWVHGKTIVDGVVRFTSVSALELADSSSGTGCLRKWKYKYGHGLKEGESEATIRGNKGHADIEKFLSTGERAHLSGLVLSGMHQLPPPGPDLCIELPLIADREDGTSGLDDAKLRASDIPVVGAIDLLHERRENYGVQDPSEAVDEPGVIKLVDHKFPGDLKNAKTAPQLPETLQMAGYAVWAFETFPELERVRLTHNYFPVRGTPRAPTILVDREAVQGTWNRAHAIGVSIRDAAKERNPDLIDANLRACHAYGKPCPAIAVCRAAENNGLAPLIGLSNLVGRAASDRLLGVPLPMISGELTDMTTAQTPSSIVARLQARASGAPAAPPLPSPLVTPVTSGPATTPPAADIAAEIARLAAVEETGDSTATPGAKDAIVELFEEIISHGLGFPQLVGAAAEAMAKARGYQLESNWLAGGGEIGKYQIDDVAHLSVVRDEVVKIVAKRAAETAASTGNTTPSTSTESTTPPSEDAKPAKEKKPSTRKKKKTDETSTTTAATEESAQTAEVASTIETSNTAPATLADAAKLDIIHVVDQTPTQVIEYGQINSPPSNVTATSATTITATGSTEQPVVVNNVTIVQKEPVPASPPEPRSPTTAPGPSGGPINVFVDCVVDGAMKTESIWPLLELIWENMIADSNASDPRCADPNGKYGFGRWKGIYQGAIRESAARGILPPGNYHLDSSMSDLGGAAAEALRQIARASGGIYAKGAR